MDNQTYAPSGRRALIRRVMAPGRGPHRLGGRLAAACVAGGAARRPIVLGALLIALATVLLIPGTSDAQNMNQAATGAPTIVGTARVGETLSVNTSGIADADGLTNVSYSYQWIHSVGGTDTDISGATGSTYTLGGADGGKAIKVRVSFRDDANNAESLTSAATAKVNRPPTGLVRVLASAEGSGRLVADTWDIGDADGLPHSIDPSLQALLVYHYQWIRVDGETATETDIGADSRGYQPGDAEIGHFIKVRVSFTDGEEYEESLTSLPYGPVAEPSPIKKVLVGPNLEPSARKRLLVSNTGESITGATIAQQYAQGFRLGNHGQGYDITSVSIDLAGVPSNLTVSLWMGSVAGKNYSSAPQYQLFDFINPPSFKVGLNKFTAPVGTLVHQNVNYFIVLSGFSSSLRIKETTSDDEDRGGETGAILFDSALERGLARTGRWGRVTRIEEVGGEEVEVEVHPAPTSRDSVLRLVVEGSRRDSGILVSNFAHTGESDTQEITSVGDEILLPIGLGPADRYLIRGVSFVADDTSPNGPILNPFHLHTQGSSGKGDRLFSTFNTRDVPGINVWTAPQGATAEGSTSYYLFQDPDEKGLRLSAILGRYFNTDSDDVDSAPGVTMSDGDLVHGDFGGRPLMALHGEPLHAMVSNLGQDDNRLEIIGPSLEKVLTQRFTTGLSPHGFRLQGVGVNIEGSAGLDGKPRIPDGPTSVMVSVYTDANPFPGEKLFDLVSPDEFAPGHNFFEAPPGTLLLPNTNYHLVWSHLGGTHHRLGLTTSNSEDSGALTGFSIADFNFRGPSVSYLPSGSSNTLQFAVYGEPFQYEYNVPRGWFHMPEGIKPGDRFRVAFVTFPTTDATSEDIEYYNERVQSETAHEAVQRLLRRRLGPEFKAVVCTETVDARTNTGMTDSVGVPIHWLDGGWDNFPTLIANTYDEFYSGEWINEDNGAYVTGNSAYFSRGWGLPIWTGCTAAGLPHPDAHMGTDDDMGVVARGTPSNSDDNLGPLGAVDISAGYASDAIDRSHRIYAISPILIYLPQP